MRWRERRTGAAATGHRAPEPVRRFELPDGAHPAEVCRPSPLVTAQLHATSDDPERGAPGIGFGE